MPSFPANSRKRVTRGPSTGWAAAAVSASRPKQAKCSGRATSRAPREAAASTKAWARARLASRSGVEFSCMAATHISSKQ